MGPSSPTFEIRRCLGSGGFGDVYLADRVAGALRSEVAVKVLHEGLDPRSQAVQRLVDEATLLAWLQHPNLLRVTELVELEGRIALVAEYIDGADFDTLLADPDPLPLGAACEALARVCDALDAAYNRAGPDGAPLHLLHRDLKPANIRIGRHGEVKLLDFGIAKAAGLARTASTRTDALIGSFPYLAPERFARDASYGSAADVFSLGCTLFEAVAGRRLLDLPIQELFSLAMDPEAHQEAVGAGLSEIANPDVKGLLAELLASNPSARPKMADLAVRLEDLAEGLGGPRLSRWCRGHTWGDPDRTDGALSGRMLTGHPLDPHAAVMPVAADTFEVGAVVPAVARPRGRWWLAGSVVGLTGVIGMAVLGVLLVGAVVWWAAQTAGPGVEPAPHVPVVPADPVDPPPAEEVPAVDPPPTPSDPTAPGLPTPSCGEPLELEVPASLGQLPAGVRTCLAAAMRDEAGRRQSERDVLGRLLLVDAQTRCSAGDCAAYEREQPAFFSVVSRSDPNLMLAWAEHLYRLDSAIDDGRLWAGRALERRDQWVGAERVRNELLAHEIDGQLAYRTWQDSPTDERARLTARNATAAWAEALSTFARDPEPALVLCRSAAGTDAGCDDRADPAARTALTLTSVPLGARVTLNGSDIGETPLQRYPVDHGTHVLEMNVDGRTGRRDIRVDATGATGWHWQSHNDSWEERH